MSKLYLKQINDKDIESVSWFNVINFVEKGLLSLFSLSGPF